MQLSGFRINCTSFENRGILQARVTFGSWPVHEGRTPRILFQISSRGQRVKYFYFILVIVT